MVKEVFVGEVRSREGDSPGGVTCLSKSNNGREHTGEGQDQTIGHRSLGPGYGMCELVGD